MGGYPVSTHCGGGYAREKEKQKEDKVLTENKLIHLRVLGLQATNMGCNPETQLTMGPVKQDWFPLY